MTTAFSPIPATMKVAIAPSAGADLVIDQRPIPELDAGHLLVRVMAAGINPLDGKIRADQAEHAQQRLPSTIGLDMAGVVVAVAPDVTAFHVGDEVFGMVGGVGGHPGTLSEYIAADARLLALKPEELTWQEAAVLPLVFITAWEGLVDRAQVKAGDKVLVHGGAGGVGHIAIQIAKSFGAEVWATGTASQHEVIQALGATPIDYENETVEGYVTRATQGEGFDIVYDTVGGKTIDASFAAVRTYTGHVVTSLGWGTHSLAPLSFRGATYSGVFTLLPLLTGKGLSHHGDILQQAARLARSGALRPILSDRRFGLAQVNEAFAQMASPRNRGKVAVTIRG
ncbi:zinc-dependent alcohol dehydrogenase family protein [Roseateles depolymerans]|uniref:Putative alcohol dehydrogenase zinc-binding domain protein n=1 Tax=Roseateles depolymerans TaxID=76731 RepID=A0A0U3DUX1_9BURK|nr:zinc-dependent alcohol dehydrogenase family protein [Roseateles depolymerans]ALV04533.1 Putative alcohol dehydrogenase zinc-binding domain protein [Roseateles depolymerans]REG14065.1 NADPH:quinone reductase-like Zn-dependent oxidoreductase [Roseateles depolymerans]